MRVRIKKARSRIRKESKTIAVWGSPDRGDGLDHDKWYRCWNCGFLNNVDRNALGDSQSMDGVIITEYTPVADDGSAVQEPNLGDALIAQENDSEGNPKGVRHNFMVGPNNGCSFCGTLNWRGDY